MQIKDRYKLISNMVDWDRWGVDTSPPIKYCQDGELANEHFCATNSELGALLMKVYFPKIKKHEDIILKAETDKIVDTLLSEIMALQKVIDRTHNHLQRSIM